MHDKPYICMIQPAGQSARLRVASLNSLTNHRVWRLAPELLQKANMKDANNKIFGYDWEDIKAKQQGTGSVNKPLKAREQGRDYGADPLGDGKFRMVPSGDVVDLEERNKRLR